MTTYTTMSEKREARAAARIDNPTRVGSVECFGVGDTKALMVLLEKKEDHCLSFGPWAIAGEVGVGIAVSFNGSTLAVHAWTGMQEMYYFLKDLMLAMWEKAKAFWTWLMSFLSNSDAVVAVKGKVADTKDVVVDTVSKAVDSAVSKVVTVVK